MGAFTSGGRWGLTGEEVALKVPVPYSCCAAPKPGFSFSTHVLYTHSAAQGLTTSNKLFALPLFL